MKFKLKTLVLWRHILFVSRRENFFPPEDTKNFLCWGKWNKNERWNETLMASATSIISYHWKSSFSISLQTFSDYDYAKQSWFGEKNKAEEKTKTTTKKTFLFCCKNNIFQVALRIRSIRFKIQMICYRTLLLMRLGIQWGDTLKMNNFNYQTIINVHNYYYDVLQGHTRNNKNL